MNVTQTQIDEALVKIDNVIYFLGLDVLLDLQRGNLEPCVANNEKYIQLKNYQFILTHTSFATSRQLWLTIQQVNNLTCSFPIRLIAQVFTWIVTNTGLNILTNSNKQIITT